MNRICLNCKYLGQCEETSVEKLLANYTCVRWDEVPAEVSAARATAIRQFGDAGARILVDPPKED